VDKLNWRELSEHAKATQAQLNALEQYRAAIHVRVAANEEIIADPATRIALPEDVFHAARRIPDRSV